MLLQDPVAVPTRAHCPILVFLAHTTGLGVDPQKVGEEAFLHNGSAAQVLLVQYPQKIFKFCEQLLESYNSNKKTTVGKAAGGISKEDIR